MAPLPYLDLHFTVRVDGEAPDLPFLGPTVRGLLGYGLRDRCCGHDPDGKGRCSMGDACTYAYLFEAPPDHRLASEGHDLDGLPQPFLPLVDFHGHSEGRPASRDPRRIRFGVRLLGDASQLAPEVAGAVLAREPFGFGARSQRFRVERIGLGSTAIDPHAQRLDADSVEEELRRAVPRAVRSAGSIDIPSGRCRLRMRFVTPVALGIEGRDPSDWAGRIIDSTARRAWLLSRGYHAAAFARSVPRAVDTNEFETVATSLRPFTIDRRSTRHGRVVRLDAIAGEVAIAGPWSRHTELLSNANICGVGRSCSFGFGRIALEFEPAAALESRHAVAREAGSFSTDPKTKPLRSSIPRWVRLRGHPPARNRSCH